MDLGDPFGFWPTEIHEQLIDDAFPLLSEGEKKALKMGSFATEFFQTPRGAYLHSMRAPGQSAEEARLKMQAFINAKFREAKELDAVCGKIPGHYSQAYHTMALQALGLALHPIMDGTSPTHRGFQVWSWGMFLPSNLAGHVAGERSITAAERQEAISLMRQAYERFRRTAPCAGQAF